jgi:hypothetical protein
MTTVTLDTLKLADKLASAGFDRVQAEAVVRAIAEAQDELVTRSALQIELAPMRAELMLLKWMMGFNLAFTMAVLWKVFS